MSAHRLSYCLVIVLSVLCGCNTSLVNFQVIQPSAISVPPHVRKIVLIDRTLPMDKTLNVLEGLLTGEGIGEDRRAAAIALEGLQHGMTGVARYEVVRTDERLQGSGSGFAFPPPLDWDKVSELCQKYQCDAVIAIETFDSDFAVTHTWKDVQQTEGGKKKTVRQYHAEGVATVKLGFRLYDLQWKTVAVEEHYDHSNRWHAQGRSAADALLHLINKSEAIRSVSYSAGQDYGFKITPHWVNVSREYYKKYKKDPDIETGGRMARVKDWEGALNTWSRALNSTNIKVRGRAAYNLAVASEMKGDLPAARDWARKAYSEYHLNKAGQYVFVLEQRIREEQQLKEQMGE